MPFRDRTGPEGRGAMTGRGAGDCAGVNEPNRGISQGWGFGRGRGAGRGFGRGRGGWGQRRGFWNGPVATPPEQESSTLETQAQYLQDALQRVNDQLKKLKG